ncbi:protein yae1 [Thrips palmi]|uniref:Protein yae1 n=1 Tax=Thrips palmi TaxID=161013 RepID=A0A6P8Y8C2_THRPL|nr:protein yae1 [Thrips palmi]
MESDSEGEKEIAERDFDKVRKDLSTQGFREGAEKGHEAAFQSGFDSGYAQGFQTAFTLGKFNGIIETLKVKADSLSLDSLELETCRIADTRHGLCSICSGNSSCSCKTPKDTATLSKNQKEFTDKFVEEQKSKCNPIFEKAGLRSLLED